jgi:hypothetical protein
MTMYVSKAWGWAPAEWPVVAFRHDATRQRLKARWRPGDAMLIVVTETEQADIGMRGRTAGWYIFSDREVRTVDVVGREAPRDHDPKRWPYGLLAYQAFSIDEPPMFKAFLPDAHERNLGFGIVTAFAELEPEEEQRVLGLPCHEVVLPRRVEIVEAEAWARRQGVWIDRRGPIPGAGEYRVRRTNEGGSTYLLEWKGRGLMKIGWAKDPRRRAAKLSEPLAPGLTGEQWRLVQRQGWSDDRIAYAMEQHFIEAIKGHGVRIEKEYFKLDDADRGKVESAWQTAWLSVRGADVDKLPSAVPEDETP